jgi:hypothetical protein
MVVERAYRVAMDDLKATQLSAIRVVRYILENPARFGVAFSKPRGDVRELADELEDVIHKIKKMYTVRHDSSGAPVLSDDAAVVVAILEKLLEEKRLQVVLFAKSPLVPGAPREFLNAKVMTYVNPLTKAKTSGYAIPLSRFLTLFLDSSSAVETAENENASNAQNPVSNVSNASNKPAVDTGKDTPVQTKHEKEGQSTYVNGGLVHNDRNVRNQGSEVQKDMNAVKQSSGSAVLSTTNESALQGSGTVSTGGKSDGLVDISRELEALRNCGNDEECVDRVLREIEKKVKGAKK